MGKKIKVTDDKKLAKPHKEGAIIELIQPSIHNQFGLIFFLVPSYSLYHARIADHAYKRLERYQQTILKISPDKTNSRLISDLEFLGKIYQAGFDLVIHTYLAFDYLCLDILRAAYFPQDELTFKKLEGKEVKEKLKHIFTQILNQEPSEKEYSKLVEIENIRHNFIHPKIERIYNAKENEWDKVPLAWVIAGKYKQSYLKTRKMFAGILKKWSKEKVKYQKPGTLTRVKRGIKSLHPFKKPR